MKHKKSALRFSVRPEVRVIVPRHHVGCRYPDTTRERDCRCPKYFYVTPGRHRVSAETDSWEMARTRAKRWETDHDPSLVEERQRAKAATASVPIGDAFDKFIEAKQSAGIKRLEKYRTLRRLLVQFAGTQNILTPGDVTVDFLDQFQQSWDEDMPIAVNGEKVKMSGLTKEKRKGFLVAFFDFCLERNWIRNSQQFMSVSGRLVSRDNPARFMKVLGKANKPPERRPLTPRLYKAILAACDRYDATLKTRNRPSVIGTGERMKIACQLMHKTGFAVTDAITARRDRLKLAKNLFFFDVNRKKTANPVYVEISPKFAQLLTNVATMSDTHPDYFFWSGNGDYANAADSWQKTFVRMRKLLDEKMVREDMGVDEYGEPMWPTFHNFRYTFVENLFLQGADVPEVATLLGDTPEVVRKHYYKFSPRLQEKANQAVRRTWSEADLESLTVLQPVGKGTTVTTAGHA
jgi:integrase